MTTTQNTTPRGAADSPKLRLLLDSFPEQNPRNFDPDAAIQLNEWGIAIVEELYRLRTLAASAPVAPAPQPAPMPYPTDAQIDAVYEQTMSQPLRSQDAPAVRRFGRAMFLCAWNAAAPKAGHIPEAGKMLGDLLARIHGDGGHYASEHGIEKAVADADRILAEWRAYKPAPLQQGEYPETLYEGGRESVDDALAVVESFGPGVQGLNDTFARQVLLGQEVRRLRAAYEHACQGRSDFRNLYRAARGAAQAAPAPASGETETCKCCGEGSARIVVRRECDTCTSVYAGVAEHRIQKSLAEPPAQEAQLNPDMPVQELRLHMGELTTDEVLVARAAIRWANTYGITAAQKETPCAPTPSP